MGNSIIRYKCFRVCVLRRFYFRSWRWILLTSACVGFGTPPVSDDHYCYDYDYYNQHQRYSGIWDGEW